MEGFFDSDYQANGFNRTINQSGFQIIGWWKEGLFHGNSKWIRPNGLMHKEGWFDQG